MRHLVLILGLLLAGPASATPDDILPTLFDVTGVAADDVLNIRQMPDAAAPVIGTLPANTTAIEVVAESQGWGRVNSGEASGWVAMRYLSPRPDVWTTGQLPADFRCFGTEPFWDVAADQTQITLRDLDDGDPQPLIAVMDRGIPRDPMRAVLGENITLIATPGQCSDGMSDRLFGLRATLVQRGDSPRLLTGCCTIQPAAAAAK